MRAVLQRVSRASVEVERTCVGQIDRGWLILLGVAQGDDDEDAIWMAEKVLNLRGFEDDAGKMNRSVLDVRGGFSWSASSRCWATAAAAGGPVLPMRPTRPRPRNSIFSAPSGWRSSGLEVATGVFRAMMQVSLVNEGPVTFVLESRSRPRNEMHRPRLISGLSLLFREVASHRQADSSTTALAGPGRGDPEPACRADRCARPNGVVRGRADRDDLSPAGLGRATAAGLVVGRRRGCQAGAGSRRRRPRIASPASAWTARPAPSWPVTRPVSPTGRHCSGWINAPSVRPPSSATRATRSCATSRAGSRRSGCCRRPSGSSGMNLSSYDRAGPDCRVHGLDDVSTDRRMDAVAEPRRREMELRASGRRLAARTLEKCRAGRPPVQVAHAHCAARQGRCAAERAPRPAQLGLPAGIPVAQGGIDAYLGMLGLGATQDGDVAVIVGSSTCHLAQSRQGVFGSGAAGCYPDATALGLYTIEAGQTATGSILDWYRRHFAGKEQLEAEQRGIPVFQVLDEQAAAVPAGAEGLVVRDDWQGNRSPYKNPQARGAIAGLSLAHGPGHIFRAIYEATACGTRHILDDASAHGLSVERIFLGGGGAKSAALAANPCRYSRKARSSRPRKRGMRSRLGDGRLRGRRHLPRLRAVGHGDGRHRAARRAQPGERRVYDELFGNYVDLYRRLNS